MGVDYTVSVHFGSLVQGKKIAELFEVHDPEDDLANLSDGMAFRFEGRSYDVLDELVNAIAQKVGATYDVTMDYYGHRHPTYSFGPNMPEAAYTWDLGRLEVSGGYQLTDMLARIDTMAKIEIALRELGLDPQPPMIHTHWTAC